MCLSIKIHRPDCVLAEGEHAGFEWAVVHNLSGHRCGYVRVPPGHPWHRKGYDDVPAKVHGGLTFAEADVPCEKGGPDDAWWVGFDCAHSGDAPDPLLLSSWPRFNSFSFGGGRVWRQEDVEAECRRLCEQASLAVAKEAA